MTTGSGARTKPRPWRRGSRSAAVLALLVGVLPGCGAYSLPRPKPAQTVQTVTIVLDLPTSVRRGAELALATIRDSDHSELERIRFEAVVLDNAFRGRPDPATARQRLRELIKDRAVLAMIGPATQDIAKATLPVANLAELTVVGPHLTESCLTQRQRYCTGRLPDRLRPRNAKPPETMGDLSFLRIPATSQDQAPAAADFAFDTMGLASAYVLSDDTLTGQALADGFVRRWQVKGGTIAGQQRLNLGATRDFRPALAQLGSARGGLVFVASSDASAVERLVPQLGVLVDVTVVLPHAAATDRVAANAAVPRQGQIVVTSLAADAPSSAPNFTRLYRAAYREAPAPFALEAYQSVEIIVEALRGRLAVLHAQRVSSLPRRSELRLAAVEVTLATEDLLTVGFDGNGDDTTKRIAFYEIAAGRWRLIEQVQFAG